MAASINAGEYKRGDLWMVDPSEVLMREEDRGRFEAPTEQHIIELALSILDHGQLQPVICRKIEANRLKLVAGYTRMAAIRLIREGFTYQDLPYGDPDLLVKIVLQNGNDEEAFQRNIIENRQRNETSPIDDAHNQQRLRERYGWQDTQIAKLYSVSPASVSRLGKLLALSREHQMLIHMGRLSLTAALDILELSEEERDAAIAAAMAESGKVDSAQVRQIVRDSHLRDDEEAEGEQGNKPKTPKAPKTGPKPRSVKEIRTWFEAESLADGGGGALAKTIVDFIRGEVPDETLKSAWDTRSFSRKSTKAKEATDAPQ